MAEPTNGGTSGGPGPPKKELSMELRLLFAFILMGVVLFVTPYFYKTVSPPVKKSAPVAANSGSGTGTNAAVQTAVPAETAITPASQNSAVPQVGAREE